MDEDVQKALKQILVMCKMPTEAKWMSQFCRCSRFAKKHWSKEFHLRTKVQDPSIRMTHVLKHCNWDHCHWLSPDILETYSELEWFTKRGKQLMCAQYRSSCSARQKHNLQSVIFFKSILKTVLFLYIVKEFDQYLILLQGNQNLSVCIEVECKNKAQCVF